MQWTTSHELTVRIFDSLLLLDNKTKLLLHFVNFRCERKIAFAEKKKTRPNPEGWRRLFLHLKVDKLVKIISRFSSSRLRPPPSQKGISQDPPISRAHAPRSAERKQSSRFPPRTFTSLINFLFEWKNSPWGGKLGAVKSGVERAQPCFWEIVLCLFWLFRIKLFIVVAAVISRLASLTFITSRSLRPLINNSQTAIPFTSTKKEAETSPCAKYSLKQLNHFASSSSDTFFFNSPSQPGST